MAKIVTQNINPTQVFKHLALLGFKHRSKVCFRAIKDGQAIKMKGLDLVKIRKLNHDGYAIYLVVNPGGDTDADITAGNAIFYEHDNLSKDEQLVLWQKLNLPQPTFQVDTGGKSIHSYWVFHEPIPVDQWKVLQTDLLNYADGDRSIKNPSRVMRLAGCFHQKTSEMSMVVTQSGFKYDYEGLRAIIPGVSAINTDIPIINIPISSNDSPPLEIFISKTNRDLLGGIGEGGRNTAGFKLAKDLFGAETRLGQLGINCSDTAENLLRNFARNCNPPLPDAEIENIIKKTQFKTAQGSLNDEMLTNCYKGWQYRNTKVESIKVTPKTQPTKPEEKAIATADLRTEIKGLLGQNFTPSNLTVKLQTLAKDHGVSEMFAEKLYKSFLLEEEKKDEALIAQEQISNFFKNTDSKLDIDKFLPGKLSVVGKLANYMGLKPEVALLVLMATAGSLIKPGSKVHLLDKTDFWQPLYIYAAIVANPGQRKSPLIRAIAKQPLGILQSRAKLAYEKVLADWKIEEKNAIENKQEIPPAPARPLFFLEGFTQESLRSKVSQQPNQGLLLLFDELSAESKNRGQYKGGKGSDKEDYLTRYDGYMRCEIRGAGEVVSEAQAIQLPILGGIQPGILAQRLGDQQDSAGEFARLTIAIQPDSPMLIGEDSPSLNLTDLLVSRYEQIAGLPQLDLTLSSEAKKAFIKIHDKIEKQRCTEEHPAIKGALSKLIGQIGRYAGIFHCLKMVENQAETFEIGVETINLAVDFARWQMNQIRTLYSQSSELSGCLLKILQVATRKADWVKPRDIIQAVRQIKLSSAQVREYFQTLANLGYGEVRGGGITLEFFAYRKPKEPEPEPIVLEELPEPEPEEIIEEELADIHFVESQLLSDKEAEEQERWEAENNPPAEETKNVADYFQVGEKYLDKVGNHHIIVKPSHSYDPPNTFRADIIPTDKTFYPSPDKIFIKDHMIDEYIKEPKFKIGDRVEICNCGDRGEIKSIKDNRAFVEVDDKAKKIFYGTWEEFSNIRFIQ